MLPALVEVSVDKYVVRRSSDVWHSREQFGGALEGVFPQSPRVLFPPAESRHENALPAAVRTTERTNCIRVLVHHPQIVDHVPVIKIDTSDSPQDLRSSGVSHSFAAFTLAAFV